MDAVPVWSHPDVIKAAVFTLGYLGALFLAGVGVLKARAYWIRRKADQLEARGTSVTPREFRRETDRRLLEVERGLASVRGDIGAVKSDVAGVSGKVSGLERDAAFLAGKANDLGEQMERMQAAQITLLRFMDKASNDSDWIKSSLLRLENRVPR